MCGDRQIEGAEQYDDGNSQDGDDRTAGCLTKKSLPREGAADVINMVSRGITVPNILKGIQSSMGVRCDDAALKVGPIRSSRCLHRSRRAGALRSRCVDTASWVATVSCLS